MPAPNVFAAKISHRKNPNVLRGAIRRGIHGIGLTDNVFRGQRVLIKANLCGPASLDAEYSMTSPDLLVELVAMAHQAGAESVVVADSPAGYVEDSTTFFTNVQFGGARLADLTSEHGFSVVDLRIGRFEDTDGVSLAAEVTEADLIINTTIPKTHHHAGVSLALKSLAMGCVEGRAAMHTDGLADAIVSAYQVINRSDNIINILDGRRGQEGLGPHFGDPINPGWMLFGTDAVGVDVVGSRLMGIDPMSVPMLAVAHASGVGTLTPTLGGEINQIDPIRFRPSPAWEFETFGEQTNVWWVDEMEVGHFRVYDLDVERQRYVFNREVEVRFNDDGMSFEQKMEWLDNSRYNLRLNTHPRSTYECRPAVILDRQIPNRLSWWSRFWQAELEPLGSEIEALAQHGSLVLGVGRSQGGDPVLFRWEDSAQHPDIARRALSPFSMPLARHLDGLGVRTLYVQRGTTATQFISLIQRKVYRPLSSW